MYGDDQQRAIMPLGVGNDHRGVQQSSSDATPARRRRHHPGQLKRAAKPIEPEEPEQATTLPPQQILHAIAAAFTQAPPLQLQTATIDIDDLALEVSNRPQDRCGETNRLLKHTSSTSHQARPA